MIKTFILFCIGCLYLPLAIFILQVFPWKSYMATNVSAALVLLTWIFLIIYLWKRRRAICIGVLTSVLAPVLFVSLGFWVILEGFRGYRFPDPHDSRTQHIIFKLEKFKQRHGEYPKGLAQIGCPGDEYSYWPKSGNFDLYITSPLDSHTAGLLGPTYHSATRTWDEGK